MYQVIKIHIRKSKPVDFQFVKDLLIDAKLPIEGVNDQFENYFITEIQGTDKIIGVMGWEQYGSFGLLRSAAIMPEFQNKGLGSKLVKEIHKDAKSKEIKRLYLLTETARNFSIKNGFKVINRSEAPEEIQQSQELLMHQCQSATVMMQEI